MTNLSLTRQSGLSLIELMISMVISLVLILGVVSIYVTSKRGYALQDGMSRSQENVRFSMDLLLHDLRMSGYPKNNTALTDPIVTAATATNDGGGDASDFISLQFESATDCLGQATPANSCGSNNCAVNKYSIDANSNLVCQGNGGVGTETIAEDILNMQILYGLDTDTPADGLANKYTKWSNILAADRSKIVSVRIGLLSRTTKDAASATNTSTYQVLDRSISVTDNRIHSVYVNTVVLRNRL
jgi:type IV pilus assembly protein PilW